MHHQRSHCNENKECLAQTTVDWWSRSVWKCFKVELLLKELETADCYNKCWKHIHVTCTTNHQCDLVTFKTQPTTTGSAINHSYQMGNWCDTCLNTDSDPGSLFNYTAYSSVMINSKKLMFKIWNTPLNNTLLWFACVFEIPLQLLKQIFHIKVSLTHFIMLLDQKDLCSEFSMATVNCLCQTVYVPVVSITLCISVFSPAPHSVSALKPASLIWGGQQLCRALR